MRQGVLKIQEIGGFGKEFELFILKQAVAEFSFIPEL